MLRSASNALLLLLLTAGACRPAGRTVSGEAFFLERIATPPGSTLEVELLDLGPSVAGRAVIAQVASPVANPPFPFQLPYDPGRIETGRPYGLVVRLLDAEGRLLFATDPSVPVPFQADSGYRIRLHRAAPDSATDPSDPWASAAARGVAFRAVGNEPGWYAEVEGGEAPAMRLVLDYGDRRLTVPASAPLPGDAGYRGEVDGLAVELRITTATCSDGMSDAVYPHRVALRVGAREYQGCGRRLR